MLLCMKLGFTSHMFRALTFKKTALDRKKLRQHIKTLWHAQTQLSTYTQLLLILVSQPCHTVSKDWVGNCKLQSINQLYSFYQLWNVVEALEIFSWNSRIISSFSFKHHLEKKEDRRKKIRKVGRDLRRALRKKEWPSLNIKPPKCNTTFQCGHAIK